MESSMPPCCLPLQTSSTSRLSPNSRKRYLSGKGLSASIRYYAATRANAFKNLFSDLSFRV